MPPINDTPDEVTSAPSVTCPEVPELLMTDPKTVGPNQVNQLMKLVEGIDVFAALDGRPVATVGLPSGIQTLDLESKDFSNWLRCEFRKRHGSIAGGAALKTVIDQVGAEAAMSGDKRPVFIRIAPGPDGEILIDLANPKGECIKLTKNGWTIQPAPIGFIRPSSMEPLPTPDTTGDWNDLRSLVNVPDDGDWRLITAWAVSALMPKGPYPLLILNGQQGSAKTTTTKCLRRLLDPSRPEILQDPRTTEQLLITARHRWLLAYDNVSFVRNDLSDALCRLSTGGGDVTRQLYANATEFRFDSQRPCILNGIDELVRRSDLAERSVVIELPRISEESRQVEAVMWLEFEQKRARIFGGLLDLVAAVMCRLPSVKCHALPRMADFFVLGTALEQHCGWPTGSFQEAYEKNRSEADQQLFDAGGLLPILRSLASISWKGTPTQLFAEVTSKMPNPRPANWPRTAQALIRTLQTMTPLLNRDGIQWERNRLPGGNRQRQCRLWLAKSVGDTARINDLRDVPIDDFCESEQNEVIRSGRIDYKGSF